MKKLMAVALFIFFATQLSAQTNIKDANIIFSTELTNISYSPKSSVSKMFYSLKKFVNGKQGIEFSFIIKPTKDIPQVNLDSIIFTASDYKILAIHKPYFDTVYSLMDISLSYNTVHELNEAAIKFLKDEMISEIMLFVDNSPVIIRLNKKSQKELNNEAKSNL